MASTRSRPVRSRSIERGPPGKHYERAARRPLPVRPQAPRRAHRRMEAGAASIRRAIRRRPSEPPSSPDRGSCSRISEGSRSHSAVLTYGRLAAIISTRPFDGSSRSPRGNGPAPGSRDVQRCGFVNSRGAWLMSVAITRADGNAYANDTQTTGRIRGTNQTRLPAFGSAAGVSTALLRVWCRHQ
jgi:hypothetical protein